MALRVVPDHPKFADLKHRLGATKGATLGYLECIWHFCAKFTPQGNIGKFKDSAIEAWVEWDGTPGLLIEALTAAGWLDEDDTHRLLVHDWADHADNSTKTALRNKSHAIHVAKPHNSNEPQTRLSKNTKNADLLKHTSPPETGAGSGAGAGSGPGPVAVPRVSGKETPAAEVVSAVQMQEFRRVFHKCWKAHGKHEEPIDLIEGQLFARFTDGKLDLALMESRHGPWAEHHTRNGTWRYSKLSFWGWIEAGMPDPPPDRNQVDNRRSEANAMTKLFSGELR